MTLATLAGKNAREISAYATKTGIVAMMVRIMKSSRDFVVVVVFFFNVELSAPLLHQSILVIVFVILERFLFLHYRIRPYA
jgi:hypothetical protein